MINLRNQRQAALKHNQSLRLGTSLRTPSSSASLASLVTYLSLVTGCMVDNIQSTDTCNTARFRRGQEVQQSHGHLRWHSNRTKVGAPCATGWLRHGSHRQCQREECQQKEHNAASTIVEKRYTHTRHRIRHRQRWQRAGPTVNDARDEQGAI